MSMIVGYRLHVCGANIRCILIIDDVVIFVVVLFFFFNDTATTEIYTE